ncbi:GTPase Era [Chlorella sorokiniana]|uniref:GTPase Era n=1 Tax=Chlorella sorokiniana TaxID=3076 RepID=A0A2P6TS91_CHLSO|nr:GTPase Era [Chlorella sorokiniana]|eukprot:PRW56927.1 GTPase Era [Chlorella sorokiniana]
MLPLAALQRLRALGALRALQGTRPAAGQWDRGFSTSSSSDSDDELGAGVAALQAELRAAAEALEAGEAAAPDLQQLLGLPLPDQDFQDVPAERQRLVQAGVVGAPNAGKSTLVNALVNAKVSAVSPKTNTTEVTRLGAFTYGDAQVVLYDTPGVVDKQHYRNPAHQRRVRGAWAVAGDCDLLLFLVDAARELQRPDPRIHRLLGESCTAAGLGMGDDADWQPPPAVLVLNKCDAVPRPQRSQLLPLSDRLRELRQFEDVFFISAKDGRGLPELRQFLLERATPGEWTLEAGQATDRGEDEQAVEVVREKLFRRLYAELPYSVQLRVTSCLPADDGSVRIDMDVLVPRKSSLSVVVGSGGSQIHAISDAAARELEEMWGHPVHLTLRAKVAK